MSLEIEPYGAGMLSIAQLEGQWLWFSQHQRKPGESDQSLFARFLPDFRTSFALRTLEQMMLHEARNQGALCPKETAERPPASLSPLQQQLWIVWRRAFKGPRAVPD